MKRISNDQLYNLRSRLSERDLNVLQDMSKLSFVTTGQIRRLHITNAASEATAIRTTNRIMSRLRDLGLIKNLDRRVGGVRSGSSALIYHLSEAGFRLLDLDNENKVRRRQLEPSATYLNHIIAVSECYVQLHELCRKARSPDATSLSLIEVEPDCWRPYKEHGKTVYLKPDLFTITKSGEYEDRWFIEMDLNTESTNVISTKCDRYRDYYKTNIEQKNSGVFPVVLWIVPDEKRKEKLQEAVSDSRRTALKMFLIITPDELENLITKGFDEENLY